MTLTRHWAALLAGWCFLLVLAAASGPAAAVSVALITERAGANSVDVATEAGPGRNIVPACKMKGFQWSWDGTRLAYVTAKGETLELHAVDIPAAIDTVVAVSKDLVSMRWAPDCKHLAYATYDAAAKVGHLLVTDVTAPAGTAPLDASGALNPGIAGDYAFSHDSRFLVFGVPKTADITVGEHRIPQRTCAIADLARGTVLELPKLNALYWAWSPTAPEFGLLATVGEDLTRQLMVVDVTDGQVKPPVRVSKLGDQLLADVTAFDWSPAGGHLAFRTALRTSREDETATEGRVFLVNTRTKMSAMVQGTKNAINFAWAPNGQAFLLEDADPESGAGKERLRIGQISDPLTGDSWLVPEAVGIATTKLAWSPDSSALGYIRQGAIYVLDLATRKTRLWCDSVNVEAISWVPDGKSVVAIMRSPKGDSLSISQVVPKETEGSATVRRISGEFRCSVSMDWAPDGIHLLALAHLNADTAKGLLFSLRREGERPIEVSLSNAVVSASWFPKAKP